MYTQDGKRMCPLTHSGLVYFLKQKSEDGIEIMRKIWSPLFRPDPALLEALLLETNLDPDDFIKKLNLNL